MWLPEERHPADCERGCPAEERGDAGASRAPRAGADASGLEPPGATTLWAIQSLAPPPLREPEGPGARWLALALATVQRQRRVVGAGVLVGLGLGVAYLLTAAPIYVVKTLLLVEHRGSVIRDSDARPGGGDVATQAEILQSPAVVADALRTIGAPEPRDAGLGARVGGWLRSLGFLAAREEATDPLAAEALEAVPALQASQIVGTNVLAVTFRTDDPERGVRLLAALTASHRRWVRDRETAAQREGLSLLRARVAELEAQIARASARYESQATALELQRDGDLGVAVRRMSLEQHARARAEAERTRIDLEAEIAALRDDPNAQAAVGAAVADDLARAEASLVELRARASARHPAIARGEQRVAALREQVRIATRRRIDELERRLRAARRTETALAEQQAREWREVAALEAARSGAAEASGAIAGLEQQRAEVLRLLAAQELSLLVASVGENSGTLVRVLEAPSVPPSPVWPLATPVLLGFGLLGVVGGVGAALAVEARRRSQPVRAGLRHAEPFATPVPGAPARRAPGF